MSRPKTPWFGTVTFLTLLSVACGSAVSTSTTPPALSSTSAPNQMATPSAMPRLATIQQCPPPRTAQALTALHHFSVSPDDVAVDRSGRLWITSRTANELFTLTSNGTPMATLTIPGGIDGVAADGSAIYAVEQNLNSIVSVAHGFPLILHLSNTTPNAGIDGVWLDAQHRLLIPDSPTGQLYGLALGSATPQLIASHLGRPVAAISMSGQTFIASETPPGLLVVAINGATHTLGNFSDLDEVVSYAGLLYVADLERHEVVAVDPVSGATRAVAVDLPAPQGLAVTAAGTLVIVDATTSDVYSAPTCGLSS
jgi:DNA-binding beta-propeller fold protein YncE